MSHDCIVIAAASLASQTEKTKFKRPRYLFPTNKWAAPVWYYALDCFVGLTPAAPNGRTVVVIAIDLFTKWLEYCILAHLDSFHVAHFIHECIVCRYGVPTRLRVDRGSEFKGEVLRYCGSMGITVT